MFDSDEDDESMRFDPPVYRQRYNFVHKILDDPKWCQQITKVVEFGCAEMDMIKYLKSLETINTILEVDCDESTLRESVFKARPTNHDYMSQRESSLDIQILLGSISDPDYRLIGSDAVICIEIIEHLNPGTLDRVPMNIFGYIEPKIAIITTPNADFNVLFPKLCGFRHSDHRFEWSREQFEDWANNVVEQYPKYRVEFHGIGKGPEGTDHLGCCSQAAVFVNMEYEKKEEIDMNQHNIAIHNKPITEQIDLLTHKYIDMHLKQSDDIESCVWDNINWDQPDAEYYKLIDRNILPFTINKRSFNDKVLDEVRFKMYLIKSYGTENIQNDQILCPIEGLLPTSEKLIIDLDNLRQLLLSSGFEIEGDNVIYDLKKDYDLNIELEEEENWEKEKQSVEFQSVNDNWEENNWDDSVEWG